MFYKILIQPAKSNKSTCKNCNSKIDQNQLRIKVVDAKKFNAFIKKHGRQNLSGEGLSRGYFECVGPRGQHISIEKYFVHINCYKPIEPHPFEKQYFDTKSLRKQDKEIFQNWLNQRNTSKPKVKKEKKDSKKGSKKVAKLHKQSHRKSKTKQISKTKKNKSKKK